MIVYDSKSVRVGFVDNIKNMTRNVIGDRYIAYRLAKKDIKSKYSKSYIGLIWDFLEPVSLATVFIFLHRSKFINTDDLTMSYSIFVIYGLLMWQIFNDTLLQSIDIVNRSKTLLSQINVSAEALVMSIIFRMSFNAIFVICAIAIFSAITSTFDLVGMLKFLFLFPLIILAGLAMGLILTPFNTLNSDVGSFVKILLRALFFTSAVLFPLPKEGILSVIGTYNPLVHLFENMRYVGLGYEVHLAGFLSVIIAIFLLLFVAWYIFHLTLKLLVERV
ncbi:ABC transporter permease [Vibrio sp. SCSIO 43137]|uniref:ABC transporter permease n=1 Tax=Vibrio sp. SCSIO 43137 TaxID=3021011 RepID=UPI0023072B8D|nr:ABC transporter permease [Vibrio sp. SCSIO 43137]WCE29873.1 ABC transporter permease [Vibrio sp. SCSIO 43137]